MGLIKEGGPPSLLPSADQDQRRKYESRPPSPIPCEECKSGEGVGLVLWAGVSRMPVIQEEHTQALLRSKVETVSRERSFRADGHFSGLDVEQTTLFGNYQEAFGITAPMATDVTGVQAYVVSTM